MEIEMPRHIQVELTNYCNLACMECPHRMMKRKLQHMEENVFQTLLRVIQFMDMKNQLRTVILHKDGEPLMCPSFDDYFARIAAITNAKMDLYTNGFLLTPERVLKMSKAVRKNRIHILVSFHAFKYDATGYDLSKVERNLLDCLDLNLPNIDFIISTHKLDLTDENWAKEFQIKWTNVASSKEQLKAVHVNTSINHWAGRVSQEQKMAHFDACPYMDMAHLFIGVTGNVLPCCIDMEEEAVFGNITEDDLSDIFIQRYEFYKTLQDRKTKEELCSRCLK